MLGMRNPLTPLGWGVFGVWLALGCALPWLDYPWWLTVPLGAFGVLLLAAWAIRKLFDEEGEQR